MNQNKKKSLDAFLKAHLVTRPLIPIIALIIAASFFIAMRTDFEADIGHFTANSIPFAIVITSALVSAAAVCIFAFLSKRAASFVSVPEESPVTIFGSVLAAVMCVVNLGTAAADISAGVQLSKFAVVSAVLMPFIGVSAILSFIPSFRFSKLRQISAILAVVSVNFSMFADYFTFVLPLNSPIRNLVTVMKCFVLLYLLSEARFAFGSNIERTTVPFFILSSYLTASVSLGYSIGAIVYAVISDTADNPNPSLISLALYAAIGIHALGRVFSCRECFGEYVEPPKEEKKETEDNEETKETENKQDN